jgi:hypothetical protein
MMQSHRHYWPDWFDSLQKNGLTDWVAWLLDAAGPLNLLGAQLVHLTAPVLPVENAQSQAIAELLENEGETRAFVHFLREHL